MNPNDFIDQIERCEDNTEDMDRSFVLRKFVPDEFFAKFTENYIDLSYKDFKTAFVETFSIIYAQNIHKILNKTLKDYDSLYDFFRHQFKAYRDLTNFNDDQIYFTLFTKLDPKIHNIFLMRNKCKGLLDDILEFCIFIDSSIEHQEILKRNEIDDQQNEKLKQSDNMSSIKTNDLIDQESSIFMSEKDLKSVFSSESEMSVQTNEPPKRKKGRPIGSKNKKRKLEPLKEYEDEEESINTY